MTETSRVADLADAGKRLLSLDFYRGLIMVLLMAESTELYGHLLDASEHTWFHQVMRQFTHHPWHGLHFWDLIQPGFMFIAGVAMALSLRKQSAQGVSWGAQAAKMGRRCAWLFFWGVLDYAVRGDHLSFELWDVLTQLSFTLMLAFLIFRWKSAYQLLFSLGLLLLTEALYRLTHMPGFDQPFTDQHNFGNYVDWLLMRKINGGGWVAINCIPTAAHTIWGAGAGKLLMQALPDRRKILLLLAGAGSCLLLGYGLDGLGVTPIIKRIATSAFTLASGGWCLAGLALCYAWIDVGGHRRFLRFFTIVGMNSIFIYLFFEIVGHRWFNEYVTTLVTGVLQFPGISGTGALIIASLVIFTLEWLLCYWLYRKKIFLKV